MVYFKAVNKLQIKKGRAEEVITRFEEVKSIHTFTGFLFMEVLQNLNDDSDYEEVQICTTWIDKSNFEAWQTSQSFRDAHKPMEERIQKGEDNPIISSDVVFYFIQVQHKPEKQYDPREEKLQSMLMKASKPVMNRLDEIEKNIINSRLAQDRLSNF
ncbi:MAG TPA: antibiotic biosynthesis monooxygenase [Pseudogracilibacillus sp.]|nr:antibiotic biosynthesis monooxygenase [Pseudogracilibacillus sp.]